MFDWVGDAIDWIGDGISSLWDNTVGVVTSEAARVIFDMMFDWLFMLIYDGKMLKTLTIDLGFFVSKYYNSDNNTNKRYWIFSPGSNASMWDEFYDEGVMGLGWDELVDFRKFNSREEI